MADDTSHYFFRLYQAITDWLIFQIMEGWFCMDKNGIWMPLIASVGVGAATFYTMTSNNQNFGQTMRQMIPLVSQMSGSNGGGQQQQAQMNGHNSGGQQHQMNFSNNEQGQQSQSQQLGPFGMS